MSITDADIDRIEEAARVVTIEFSSTDSSSWVNYLRRFFDDGDVLDFIENLQPEIVLAWVARARAQRDEIARLNAIIDGKLKGGYDVEDDHA